MSIITLDTLKKYLAVTRVGDPDDDDLIDAARLAAESGIGSATQRLWQVASSATTRSYVPSCRDVLRIHDCTEITGITSDGTALDAADWQAEPVGDALTGEARPFEQVRRWAGWGRTGHDGQATVVVTAKWGWTAIPPPVVEACKILAKDVLANQSVSFGIAAFTEYAGVRARENEQVAMLVGPYRRVESFGIA